MRSVLTLNAMLFCFYFTTAQVVPEATANDPADKVLLATDTVTLKTTQNMEKRNSETVKTKDHPKVTRKIKAKKDSTSTQKRK